jgi:hypothetical protein
VSGDVYAHAKLLNVLASLALARRLPAEQVTVNLVHPGMAWTQMTQSMTSQTIPSFRLVWPLLRLVQRRRSPEKAALHVAVVASAPQLSGHTGQYFEAKPTPRRLSARELDGELQERAWQLGAELVASAPTSRAAGARPQANSQLTGRQSPSQTEGNQAEWTQRAGLSALEGDDTPGAGWKRGRGGGADEDPGRLCEQVRIDQGHRRADR